MTQKKYYKFLDDKQEWVIRDRTNRRNEYRVGRNKIYAENIVDLLNKKSEKINELEKENEDLLFTLRTEQALHRTLEEEKDEENKKLKKAIKNLVKDKITQNTIISAQHDTIIQMKKQKEEK